MKSLTKLFIALFIVVMSILSISVVQAADSPFVIKCVQENSCDNINVFVVLAIQIGSYVFSFVGAVALLFFVYGGITMIISRGNKETISKGTKAMTAAVIGLVVAFSGYAVITFLGKTVGLKTEYLNKSVEIRLV